MQISKSEPKLYHLRAGKQILKRKQNATFFILTIQKIKNTNSWIRCIKLAIIFIHNDIPK